VVDRSGTGCLLDFSSILTDDHSERVAVSGRLPDEGCHDVRARRAVAFSSGHPQEKLKAFVNRTRKDELGSAGGHEPTVIRNYS
jgi:hypothetical protein